MRKIINKSFELEYNEPKKSRLDAYLNTELDDMTRSQIQKLIKEKYILVNGESVAKTGIKIVSGDKITVNIPEEEPIKAVPEDIPIEVVYEDKDVLVVNKPQGMVVHPAAGHPDKTLVNAILYHCQINDDDVIRPGIVHRIDKDTSGLLMIAKNNLAKQSLMKQLKEKSNLREYLAIVHGNFKEKNGRINAPLGRSKFDRKKQAVVEDGRHAVTHFEVLEQFENYSLLKLKLETGRTHQIRVHMQYIGHPVAGDPLYGPKNTLKGQGQFLHAETLGFEHPRTHEWMQFSIEPPKIFQETLKQLRSKQ
ncbi:RluA family pseudouridine synthase [Companilactobacillus alimentarius]|uniref:RluA family pseudouridine synthase n=1 Tax=Companilactobacillus alimentarius TaxID=1602 RepID=UPI0006F0F312|nr:RluA family pseudouridine synthase [Companilactobacillus alimentarius]KRK75335.1 pseudouridine synthase [Companilactobacillus alimentarius DSM 20249]MDT6951521.1 RluA family pseudouridine synthase [Companilactobacillus alimentarius]GEO43882.1 pseudouridine synthase [Companilactobacillus alimentarius]